MEATKILILFLNLMFVKAELFESVNEFKGLIDVESKFVEHLESFVKHYRRNLEYLELKLQYYKSENKKAQNDPDLYVSNALSTLALTQRLTNGIELIDNRSFEVLETFSKSLDDFLQTNSIVVSDIDKIDIVREISHLQETQRLNTKDLANGIVNGKVVRDPLLSQDIFEVGNHLNYLQNEAKATEWYKEALNALEKEKFKDIKELLIYESMFVNYWNNNKTIEALEVNKIILQLDPYNEQAHYMQKLFDEATNKGEFVGPEFDMD